MLCVLFACSRSAHTALFQSQLLDAAASVRPAAAAAAASARAVRAASASVRPQQSRNALEPLLLTRGRALYRPTSSLVFSLELRDACTASARRTLGSSVYSVHSLLDQLQPPLASSAPPAPASSGESVGRTRAARRFAFQLQLQLHRRQHQSHSRTSLSARSRRRRDRGSGSRADGCAVGSSRR